MAKQIWKPGNMLYPLPAVMVSVEDKEGNQNFFFVYLICQIFSSPKNLFFCSIFKLFCILILKNFIYYEQEREKK